MKRLATGVLLAVLSSPAVSRAVPKCGDEPYLDPATQKLWITWVTPISAEDQVTLLRPGQFPSHRIAVAGDEQVELAAADPQAGGGIAVNDHRRLQAAGLLVTIDVAQIRVEAEFIQQQGGPAVEFVEVARLQRILELRPAEPPPDADVLRGLED